MHLSTTRIGNVLFILTVLAVPFSAAAISLQTVAVQGTADVGTSGEAVIVLRLSNADGTPFAVPVDQAEKIPLGPDGSVELKGSKWKFQTLLVPRTYVAVFKQQTNVGLRDLPEYGQLRIFQIVRVNDGVLWLRVRPEAGPKGGQKVLLKWAPGEYVFHISYNDGVNQGDTLGALTIK